MWGSSLSISAVLLCMYLSRSILVYCDPGLAVSGVPATFTCLAPKVIPRADKFGISLIKIDLNPFYETAQIKFISEIKSAPGTNLTSVVFEIINQAPQTIDYQFMVIVVGHQVENTWMDLVGANLPNDPILNPLSQNSTLPIPLTFSEEFSFASKIKFTSGTFTLVAFISSLYVDSSTVVGINMKGLAINSTHFKIQYDRSSTNQNIRRAVGTIVVFNPAAITTAGGETLLVPKTLISVSDINYKTQQPLWGPSFNTKCIIGYDDINYSKSQAFRVLFSKTSYGNYFIQKGYTFAYTTCIGSYYNSLGQIVSYPFVCETNTSSAVFKFSSNFLCFTNKKTQCGQQEIFYDTYTDACLTDGNLCPVPTAMPALPFTYPIPCTNCSSIFCLTCQVSNRNHCTLCNATFFRTHDPTGKCVCMIGFIQKTPAPPAPPSPKYCAINCTYHITGCKTNDCTSLTNCTLCSDGFYLNPVGTDDFNCLPCSINCRLCKITGCTLCENGFIMSQTATCDICSNLLQYCATCTVYFACTSCQNSPTIFLLSNSLCKSCQDIHPHCTSCQKKPDDSDLLCNHCIYPLVPDSTRLQCISCSDAIHDCVECVYDSILFQPKCTFCLPKFKVDENFKCQSCQKGTWIQRECYYIIGCSSIALINGRPTCLACTEPHFEFHAATGRCVCQRAYELHLLDQACLPKCGDSIRAQLDEECDDGNLFSADGCSDQCKVEPDFVCNQNSKDLSKCLYRKDIKVFFDYILKVENKNQAKIYFHVEPPSLSVSKVDWSKAIMFTFSESVKTTTSYENGVLIITVDYETDIEGKDLRLDIIYDPKFIIASHQQLILPMRAMNGQLSFEEKSKMEKNEAVGTAGFVLGMICLVFYLLSTFFHKMIGLETLQFIQLIYFVRVITSESSQSSLLAFNSLRYSNGYNDIYKMGEIENSKLANQIPAIFLKINMKLYYLDNCNLMLIPIGLATLAYVYFSIKKARTLKNYLETKELFLKDEFFDLRRKVDLVYGNFIFSYILSLLYLTVFSMLLYELSKTGSQATSNYATTSYGVSLVVLFFIAIIFCLEAYNGIQKHFKQETVVKENVFNQEKALEHDANCQNQDYHPLYVPVYLMYQLLIIVLINCIFVDFSRLPEVLSGLATIYMFVIMFWRPYLFTIHNFAIVFNQGIVVIFLMFQLLGKYGVLNETLMQVNLYLTISLIGVALFLQAARLYIQNSSPPQVFKKTQVINFEMRKKVDLADEKNKYLMDNQIKQALKDNFKQEEVEELGKVDKFNREFLHKVMNKKKLKIDISKVPGVQEDFYDKINKLNDGVEEKKPEASNEDEHVDIFQVKERLRRELNYKRNKKNFF